MEVLATALVGAAVGAFMLAGLAILPITGSFLVLVIASFTPSGNRHRDRVPKQSEGAS